MQSQPSIIALRCTNCGASLSISAEMNQFACGYCGTGLTVERQGGTISLRIIEQAIGRVQISTDKTAAELALKRLDQELQQVVYQQILIIQERDKRASQVLTATIVAIAFVIFIASLIGSSLESATLAVIFAIAGIGFILYGAYKLDNEFRKAADNKLDPILRSRKQIEDRISVNKSIVDS